MPDVFIDYSNDGPDSGGQPSPDAAAGSVGYRKRPPDKGCLHGHCDYPAVKRDGGPVEVVCLECAMRWLVVPEPRR